MADPDADYLSGLSSGFVELARLAQPATIPPVEKITEMRIAISEGDTLS
jgi:hypothetical protein